MLDSSKTFFLLLITGVTSNFDCPTIASVCVCGMRLEWREGSWQNLAVVNCSFAGLTTIPDFSSLEQYAIDLLLLNNNNLTDITPNAFRNLSVKELILSRNPLKSIRQNVFAPLKKSVRKLDLLGVELYIDDGLVFLSNLNELAVLDLGYNHLKNDDGELTEGIFDGLGLNSLKVLNLRVLKLNKLREGALRGLPGLEELDISINFMVDVPSELRNLKKLKVLKMNANELLTLKNDTFKGMASLENLYFGANELMAVEDGAFAGLEESVVRINFYQNLLTSVPVSAISNLRKLKMLGFAGNSIQTLDNGTFVGSYKLEILELDKNPLVYHEDMFTGAEDSLTSLFIRENKLASLPLHALRKLKRLSHIDAANNNISEIDKSFFGNIKPSKIYLMWNRISKVDPAAFENLPDNLILDLHRNQISDVSFITKLAPCKFEFIDVSNNQLVCDCSIAEILITDRVSSSFKGECAFTGNESKLYRFDDPQLLKRLTETCNRTYKRFSCQISSASFNFLRYTTLVMIALCTGVQKMHY